VFGEKMGEKLTIFGFWVDFRQIPAKYGVDCPDKYSYFASYFYFVYLWLSVL